MGIDTHPAECSAVESFRMSGFFAEIGDVSQAGRERGLVHA
jgi:hypothetical protein